MIVVNFITYPIHTFGKIVITGNNFFLFRFNFLVKISSKISQIHIRSASNKCNMIFKLYYASTFYRFSKFKTSLFLFHNYETNQ